jgi:hypothetical protein
MMIMLMELIVTVAFVLGPFVFAFAVDALVDLSRKYPIF